MNAAELTPTQLDDHPAPAETETTPDAGTYPVGPHRGDTTLTQHHAAHGYRAPDRDKPVCATGCQAPVDRWGHVCAVCVDAFGDYLQPSTSAPALDYDAIVARDIYVSAAYRQQQRLRAESEAAR